MDITSTPASSKSSILKLEDCAFRNNHDTSSSNITPRASRSGDIFEFVLNRDEGTLRIYFNMEDLGVVQTDEWLKTAELFPVFHIDGSSVSFI